MRAPCSVHATHAGVAASAAGAGGHLRGFRAASRVRGEGGKLLLQMLLAAGGTFDLGDVRRPHQLLKLRSAIFTTVFVKWHLEPLGPGVPGPYINIRLQIRSMTPRISAARP